MLRPTSLWLVGLSFIASAARAEEGVEAAAEDVREGRRVALLVCSTCHVVERGQPFGPSLEPPATPFQTIAQRSNIDADYLRTFLTTTHSSASNLRAMPNPQLTDTYVRQVTAYLLSLRKRP